MMKHFLLFISLSVIAAFSLSAQTIYQLQGQTAKTPYENQVVTTKGIVTAVYNGSYFIQDGDTAWSGMYIYDNKNFPTLGDSIELTGKIVEYYDFTEIKDLTSFKVLSSENQVPEPIVLKAADITEAYESVFVRVEDATCTKTSLGYGEWQLTDETGNVVVNDLGVAYIPLLDIKYTVTGPVSYSFNFYKLEPRNINDIRQHLNLYLVKEPKPVEILTDGLKLQFEVNDKALASMKYGLTTEYELGEVYTTVSSTLVNIKLDGLASGSIYYTQTRAFNETDTTPVSNGIFATKSESSQEIQYLFTQQAFDNGKSCVVDTIVSFLNKAQKTLDITMYDLTNWASSSDSSNYEIIDAINAAYDRGVKVRFISDDVPVNTALKSLNSSISILRGNSEGIMHDKFVIIDAEDANGAWVMTGSTNWTYNNLLMDFNNIVFIQDQSLAKAYTLEFNEMWGGKELVYDSQKSRFGSQKTDNTPHFFRIGEVRMELYFSPSDKTTSKITAAIDSSKQSVDFALMVLTENALGGALVNAHKRGVETFGFIDYIESSGSDFQYLLENGVDVHDFVNEDKIEWPDGKTLHHKFCIIDRNSEKPLVITGTHNWSSSAESKNDENTLFIYDGAIADLFYKELDKISQYNYTSINDVMNNCDEFLVYPNPAEGNVILFHPHMSDFNVSVFDVYGKRLVVINNFNSGDVLNGLNSGLYLVKLCGNKTREFTKLLIVN